jgi:hypothetical protein
LGKVKENIQVVDKVKCVRLQTLRGELEALQMKPLKSIYEFHTQIIMVQNQIKRNKENFEYMRISENIWRPLDLKSCYSYFLGRNKRFERNIY